ncbi:cell wall-binding repeat-containing protein [Romboutsia maritimum]|uniref:Cell wall-binding repeat-containing protein n=1 Tax=Romboutsia maritimum TaxID=2020948 RepID=A0A371IS01_9FIRM|nr:cell wall-binding repeat-containing protein [Romboutsia maritimum]RDY23260.1 cell wall-binding repeat-containing protein [Romboutsia maritimum]
MSRRRKLSVAMAGAMVATAVVPTFAATINDAQSKFDKIKEKTISSEDKEIDDFYDDLKDILEPEYDEDDLTTDLQEESVFELEVKVKYSDSSKDNDYKEFTKIDNEAALEKLVNKLKKGDKVVVRVKDNGHITKNGDIFSTDTQYSSEYEQEVADDVELAQKAPGYGEKYTLKVSGDKVTVTFNEEKTPEPPKVKEATTDTVTTDGKDTEKPTDGKDTEKPTDGKDTEKPAEKPKDFTVTVREGSNRLDFTKLNNKNDGFEKCGERKIAESYSDEVTINSSDEIRVDMDKIYDGLMLNLEGSKLTDLLVDKIGDEIHDGIEDDGYVYVADKNSVSLDEGDKEITLEIQRRKTKDSNKEDNYNLYKTLVIKGSDKGQLRDLTEILKARGDHKVKLLGGESRFETAIKIAKEGVDQKIYNGESIVLVSSTSMVDGLTAGPLAAAKEAPILLTEKGNLTDATADYIRDFSDTTDGRLKDMTVYIVGGESVISKDVEKDLNKIGVKVERLGGSDRQETSIKVAKKIDKDFDDVSKVFVVGANGEADAMSVSPVASNKDLNDTKQVAPILVSGVKDIPDNMLDFIDDEMEVEIIGGTSAVSKEAEKKLEKAAKDEEINRVSGKDRFETNRSVLGEYYSQKSTTFAVAKDSYNGKNNEELVDALAAGPFLALQKESPNAFLVLASDKSRVEGRMEQAVENTLAKDIDEKSEAVHKKAKLFQIGAGVKSAVIEILADKIGLNK